MMIMKMDSKYCKIFETCCVGEKMSIYSVAFQPNSFDVYMTFHSSHSIRHPTKKLQNIGKMSLRVNVF